MPNQTDGYLACLSVGAMGFGLSFRSLAALLIQPLLAHINAEENLLRSQFGDEYNSYCARTSRMSPGYIRSHEARCR